MKRAVLLTVLALAACKAATPPPPVSGAMSQKAVAGTPLYATIQTSLGDVVVKLYSKEAPKTVANFVGLATGERDWKNPLTGAVMKGVPLYNTTIFHRVIPGFMVQGGDPLGTGTGDPGYSFEDEFQSGHTFDRVGLLAMANAGPNTNGSQFFITVSTPQYLNGKHTIFGEVVKGYELVEGISKVARDRGDRPQQPVSIKQIVVSETPP